MTNSNTSTTAPKFNAMQLGRAIFVWNIHNLIPSLEERGVDLSGFEKPLNKNAVLSARQSFIRTLEADDRITMDKQGIETYFRNIQKEFFDDNGAKVKVVLQEEVDAVEDAVLATIDAAVEEYEAKMAKKEAKEAEKAQKAIEKAERDAKRKAEKEAKEAEKAEKAKIRQQERQRKAALKAEEEAKKAAEKKAAQEQAKAMREQMLAGLQTGGTAVSSDSDS